MAKVQIHVAEVQNVSAGAHDIASALAGMHIGTFMQQVSEACRGGKTSVTCSNSSSFDAMAVQGSEMVTDWANRIGEASGGYDTADGGAAANVPQPR